MTARPAHQVKRGPRRLGSFGYDEILGRLRAEVDKILAERGAGPA